jgi:prepilin-type N-terminal cleavage/methylation domain-containing protein/prepilin-type processing-associated H-X9-DG protein
MLALERKGEMRYCWDMTHRHQVNNPAFTLTEMLVVVAIIGILAALLLTATTRAIVMVRRIHCANNERQLGQAMQLFVGDNHVYPQTSRTESWTDDLNHELEIKTRSHQAFFMDEGIWKCPSAVRPVDWPPPPEETNEIYASYGYNSHGMWTWPETNIFGLGMENAPRPSNPPPASPVHDSEIVNPSDMMALGDGFVGHDYILESGRFGFGRTYMVQSSLKGNPDPASRHHGKANVVFCDGHVESPTLKFLFADTSDAALVRWNRDHLPHREKLSP